MRFPLMLRSTHERQQHDLIERHEAHVTNLKHAILQIAHMSDDLLKVRNNVLEVTAENARQWQQLLDDLKCPGCGSPYGEFQIVIPTGEGARLQDIHLVRRCLKCKSHGWRVRAPHNLKNVGNK